MEKELSDMTLEELWELFPIVLTEHRPWWRGWFEEESAKLKEALPAEWSARISHIGSTAVDSIWAKPIVDILVEAGGREALDSLKPAIVLCGYTLMSSSEERASFNKGYTPEGYDERVFHLHLRNWGDNDELYFRDYMNEFPEAAREYERLKLTLWKEYEHDRDGYTERKGELVRKYTQKALVRYGDRYRRQGE